MKVDPSLVKGTFVDLLGIEFLELRPGYCKAVLSMREDLKQPWGPLHGGVIMGLADTVASAGLVVSLQEGQGFSTIELKINFLRIVKGGRIKAEARCLHQGKRTSVWEIDVLNEENLLVAKATTSLMILDMQRA